MRPARPQRFRVALCLVLSIAAGAGSAAGANAAARAGGGERLIESAERAPVTLVGRIRAPEVLDRHGRAASLEVELSLKGSAKPGSLLAIAWEELAPARDARFVAGERILVILEALPGASLWRTRIPDAGARTRTLTIAARGDAFLRSPSLGTLSLLEHYLKLAADERAGPPGTGLLCELARRAEAPVALDAVARLAARSDLDAQLGPERGAALVDALLRPDPPLAAALLELIGSQRLASVRPALEARVNADLPSPSALVFEALARLPGGLSPERIAALQASPVSDKRVVGARYASGPAAETALEALLRRDPSPDVRASAAARLSELGGRASIDALVDGLADAQPRVRAVAAHGLASLGEPAVRPLRRVVDGNDPEAIAAAVAALAQNPSSEAQAALRELADSHHDDAVRRLAGTALGRPLGEAH